MPGKTPRRTLSTAKIDLRSLYLATGRFIEKYSIFPKNQGQLVHLIVEDHSILHAWLEDEPERWRQFKEWQEGKLQEKGLDILDESGKRVIEWHLDLALLPERPINGRPRSDFDLLDKPTLAVAIPALVRWGILPNKRLTLGGRQEIS